MQVLYQIDLRGEADIPAIAAGLRDGPDKLVVQENALALATAAWADHPKADVLIVELAPAWPTHRQPPVDRAILRLAYHEMISGHAPVKVVINEAVELSKDYCSEHSPAFVNGVLDKMAKRLAGQIPPPQPYGGDAWLQDAVTKPAETAETEAKKPQEPQRE